MGFVDCTTQKTSRMSPETGTTLKGKSSEPNLRDFGVPCQRNPGCIFVLTEVQVDHKKIGFHQVVYLFSKVWESLSSKIGDYEILIVGLIPGIKGVNHQTNDWKAIVLGNRPSPSNQLTSKGKEKKRFLLQKKMRADPIDSKPVCFSKAPVRSSIESLPKFCCFGMFFR